MWDWTPLEGVQSVRDVMDLIVAGGYHFPASWGIDAPAGAESGFGPEMEKSFDHLIMTTRELTHMDHMGGQANSFGRDMSVANAMTLAGGDMHEHLGAVDRLCVHEQDRAAVE